MDEARRAALLEKRRLFQLRLQRQNVSARYRPVACALRAAKVRCSKLSPEACRLALGTLASGPSRDERLDWTGIGNGICRIYANDAQRDAYVAEALADCTGWTDPVAVVWHPFEAGLRIAAGDLVRHAPLILDQATEIWIVDARGSSWLIEVAAFDSEVCHTRSMPLFVGGADP